MSRKTYIRNVKNILTGEEMNFRTCAVCDVLKKEKEFVTEISDTFYRRCRNILAPDTRIPSYLVDCYDVSAFIPELQNVLLSKKRLANYGNNEIRLRVCASCYKSLPSGD